MISVIISAYKNDKYLIEALDSVVESAKNFEYEILLGVDNCPETMNGLIKNYNKLPKKLKIFYFPKVGTYVIRNSLSNISKYDKIIFFDSDDIMSDITVEESIRLLDSNDIAKFKYYTFHNNFDKNKKTSYQKSPSYHYGCFAIKKESFLNLNGFEPWICAADGEFKWRSEANNYKISGVEKPGFYYRRHNTNLTIAGPTNMSSPLRKHYHNIKNDKIKRNQKQKLERLYNVKFLTITKDNINNYNSEFNKLNINNPYNSEMDFELNKKKKSDALNSVFNLNTKESPKEIIIKKTLENTKKQINYDNVNQIFNGQRHVSIVSKTPENRSNNSKTNTEFLNKILSKNKKRNR
jgi:hypothetical protein